MIVRIKHPNGSTGVGYEGKNYHADENGVIELPKDHASVFLNHHGFVLDNSPVVVKAKRERKKEDL